MHRFRIQQKRAVEFALNDFDSSIGIYNHNYSWFLNFYYKHYKEMNFENVDVESLMQKSINIANECGYEIPFEIPI